MNDKLHYAYARGYYDGRANGVSESPFVHETDEMHQMYKYGYDRGVADYCEFDMESPLLDAQTTQCHDCDTIIPKQDASITTAGRVVCPTCAEATV
jgi:formylmethanofuran dehydrogenase subunit E